MLAISALRSIATLIISAVLITSGNLSRCILNRSLLLFASLNSGTCGQQQKRMPAQAFVLKYDTEVAVSEGFSAPESYPRQCRAALWGSDVGIGIHNILQNPIGIRC